MKETGLDFPAWVQGRRSVRRFKDEAVPRGALENVLQAAIWAPSAHNRQPWRFVVLQDRPLRRKLALAMGERLRADRLQGGDNPAEVEADVARSIERIERAGAAILLCLTMKAMDRYPDDRRSEAEHQMAVQSVAMAGENLLLAAHAQGLGAGWLCAPLFAPDVVRKALDLPEDWEPQSLIILGYPQHTPSRSTREPLGEVVLWR